MYRVRTICKLSASVELRAASCQYEPARRQKPSVRVRKMISKTTLVRMPQMR